MKLIKVVAKKNDGNNWDSTKTKLTIRLAFGARQSDDPPCTESHFKSPQKLNFQELLLSQDDKNEARDKYIAKQTSVNQKQEAILVDVVMDQLYNDPSSPIYHGFLSDMAETIKDGLLFDKKSKPFKELVSEKQFPPSDRALKELLQYVVSISNEFEDLVPKREYFPPYGNQNSGNPPTLSQWRKTENGREYFGGRRQQTTNRHNARRNGESNLSSRHVSNFQPQVEPKQSIGLIEVETPGGVTRVKYSDHDDYIDNQNIIGTDVTLLDVVGKASGWERYNSNTHERYFEVRKANGTIFTTYTKPQLKNDTLSELLNMMKFADSGESLRIFCGVREKIASRDIDDDMSNMSE